MSTYVLRTEVTLLMSLLPDHGEDIGIECSSHLISNLPNNTFWKGLEFSTSTKPPSLQYVQISDAYEAIKGREFIPDLIHVTISSSVYGVVAKEMSYPLNISDSTIRDNLWAGIRIKSGPVTSTIENTVVENTIHGDGLSYSGLVGDPVDFCSVNASNITFPVIFQASGKSRTTVDCAKVEWNIILCLLLECAKHLKI